MSTACKTTEKPKEVVCSEERGVELMGVDLQTDPYFVESEGKNDGLFGDAAAAEDSRAVSAAEGVGAADSADNLDAEAAAEASFLPGPQELTLS